MQISDRETKVVITVTSGQCLALWRGLEPYHALGRRTFVLDLSRCEFLNSVNVAAILIARSKLAGVGATLTVVGLTPRMQAIFRALRLERIFELNLPVTAV